MSATQDTSYQECSGRRLEFLVFGATHPLTYEEAGHIPKYNLAESLHMAETHAQVELMAGKWNPGSPPTMTAFDLLQAVQARFHHEPSIRIELIRSLGGPLDIHWGVDCYFQVAGTEVKVTVDVTTNWTKVRLGQKKADVFLTPNDLDSPQSVKAFAKKVAKLLRERTVHQELQVA